RGDLLRQKQPGAALAAYRAAFQTANSQEPARLPDAALRLGALLHSLHENQEALTVQEQLFAYARTANATDLAVESLVAQVGLLVEMGLDGKAAGTAGGSNGLPGEVGAIPRHHRIRLLCEGALAEWQAEAAWRALESLTRTGSGDSLFLPVEWPAIDADLRARIAAMRADIRTAYSRYRQISSQFATSQDHAARCLLYCARLALDEAGDLNQCADYLSQTSSFAVEVETDVTRRLLACRLLARRGQAEKAQATLQELLAEVQATGNAFVRLPVAIVMLALGGDAKTLVDQISQDLSTIEPTSQRLVLLEGMQRCPVLAVSSAAASRLVELLPTPESSGQDPALAGLRLAEVHRVCGRTEEALGLLEQAWGKASGRTAVQRRIFLAYDRLGWPSHLLTRATDLLLRAKPPEISDLDLLGLVALEQAERLWAYPTADNKSAGELLQRAIALLNHPSSLWTARITALQARLALTAGDRANGESLGEAARKAYLSLGDERAAAALGRELAEAAPEPEPISKSLTPTETPFLNLTVVLDEKGARVQVETSDRRFTEDRPVIDEAVQDAFFLKGDSLYAEGFPLAFSRDWLAVSRQMGALLFPEEWELARQLDEWPEGVLRFSTQGRQSQWLPWELARPADNAPPLPLTWEKLCFYRHIPYTTPPVWQEQSSGVLIVRMSEVRERVVMRGSRQLLGADIANLYRQAGVTVNELQEPTSQELTSALDSLRPSVLHLIANIREQNGSLALDVGADDFGYRSASRGSSKAGSRGGFDSSASLELTPRELGNALRRAGAEPFVILDTPAPGSVTEWVRQLCLRNAFAGEWAQNEPPPGILATGMGFQEEQSRIYEVLLEMLPQGVTFQALTRRIWQQAAGDRRLEEARRYDPNSRLRSGGVERIRNTSDLPGYFSYVSAALFTGDPTLRIPPLAELGR
ncbi:MAG: hypothetical protein HY328_13500, partial [Chloroflexi bacterium]|nr:hypothetical protein [Chloroflexota bacterium]